jgi:hypothetical protein
MTLTLPIVLIHLTKKDWRYQWCKSLKQDRQCHSQCLRFALTRCVSIMEQVSLTLAEHMCSLPFFLWVRVAQSFVSCILLCRSLFVPPLRHWLWHCLSCFNDLHHWYLQSFFVRCIKTIGKASVMVFFAFVCVCVSFVFCFVFVFVLLFLDVSKSLFNEL